MTTPVSATAGNAQAAQRDADARPQGPGVFQRKYGPLPGWGWAVLAGGAAIAYFWWKNRSAQTAAAGAYTAGANAYGPQGGGPVDAANFDKEIADLQGQLAKDEAEIDKLKEAQQDRRQHHPHKPPGGQNPPGRHNHNARRGVR